MKTVFSQVSRLKIPPVKDIMRFRPVRILPQAVIVPTVIVRHACPGLTGDSVACVCGCV
jgi:branched-subunit amino acid transport protein